MQAMDSFRLDGRCIIVTGAAQGLGKAMAIGLAEAGANVVILDLDVQKAECVAQEITESNGRSIALKVDVTDTAQAQRAVQTAKSKFGKIYGLFNNAGIAIHGPLLDYSSSDWDRQIEVNVKSLFVMSKAIGRELVEQRQGVIINMASMSGVISNNPQPQVPYNTSKGAVIAFTRSLASEWVSFGIRVNAIAPGYMRTEQTKAVIEKGELVSRWMMFTPMGRFGEPHELVGMAIYLASDASSYVTGQVFCVDGGYTMW